MIEVNLVPDVKQEFIKAQRMRNTVISIATLVAIGCGVAVVLVALYVFGAQGVRGSLADKAIDDGIGKLQDVEDFDKVLTVQNQLSSISAIHDETKLSARLFTMLAAITPRGDDKVTISRFDMDTEEGMITIEGKTAHGYKALDVFKKIILATEFVYVEEGDNETKTMALTDEIIDGDRSYGEDENGRRSLQFSFTFSYDENLFNRQLTGEFRSPNKGNATDSALEIPGSLFAAPNSKETE